MSFRLAPVPIAAALLLAAACNPVVLAQGGGGSGGHTTTTTPGTGGSTTSTGTTTTSTSGGACASAADCPASGNACVFPVCVQGVCGTVDAAAGTVCQQGGAHCDGAGNCVGCLVDADCPATGTACAISVCSAHQCTTIDAAKGTACADNGGVFCDGVGKCIPPTCTDLVKDGAETDVDCGGTTCPKCQDGKTCVTGADCVHGVCAAGVCGGGPVSCTNGIEDGTETDVDCGGGVCAPCVVGKKCLVNADCTSNACDALALVCVSSQCADHHKDGVETDVDCGGATCVPCAAGKTCTVGADCVSGTCTAGVCSS